MSSMPKGWLQTYIDHFKEFTQTEAYIQLLEVINTSPHAEEFLYKIIQPTGLMYGLPVKEAELKGKKVIQTKTDKAAMLLTESLMQTVLFHKANDPKFSDYSSFFEESIQHISTFYAHLKGKTSPNLDVANTEKALQDRVKVTSDADPDAFWQGYFQNSLLFLDIVYFSQWIHHGDIDNLKVERDKALLTILQIIAAAAHANAIVETEEQKLFDNFLKSAELEPQMLEQAQSYMQHGLTIDALNLNQIDSWILRKYYLEIAILTVWSDKLIEVEETEFLKNLCKKLGFDHKDYEESMIAVETFVLNNWDQLPFIQQKSSYDHLFSNLALRMRSMIKRNMEHIQTEIAESKELVQLLQKARTTELSDEEKKKVKTQILDILKIIPSFTIFMLPGGTLLLPLLLKVLPKELIFPTAFLEKD